MQRIIFYFTQLTIGREPEHKRKECPGLMIQTDKGNTLIEIFQIMQD